MGLFLFFGRKVNPSAVTVVGHRKTEIQNKKKSFLGLRMDSRPWFIGGWSYREDRRGRRKQQDC